MLAHSGCVTHDDSRHTQHTHGKACVPIQDEVLKGKIASPHEREPSPFARVSTLALAITNLALHEVLI